MLFESLTTINFKKIKRVIVLSCKVTCSQLIGFSVGCRDQPPNEAADYI